LHPGDEQAWEEGRTIFESWGVRVETVRPPRVGRAAQAWRCLRHGRPWVNRFFVPELASAAGRLLAEGQWDVVHAEGILSAQHLARRLAVGSVLIARDSLSLAHWRAWRLKREPREWWHWLKIRRMEADLYRRFDRIMAIAPGDQAEMRRLCPGARVDLLPNGVDLENFSPRPELEEPDTVVFSGVMSFGPNADGAGWFVREVWPQVRRRRPRARLLLAGRDPGPRVAALADDERGVVVTGRVERIQDVLAQAAVIVAPLRYGTGMKNKVLEGAAMGRAMVVSPVSLEDIELDPGRDLLLAATAGEFAEKVIALLENAEERRRMGAAARAAVEQKYSWATMAERLWECYRELAGREDSE
jgi:glycosyltransferase involved in cell wall biosynthesis